MKERNREREKKRGGRGMNERRIWKGKRTSMKEREETGQRCKIKEEEEEGKGGRAWVGGGMRIKGGN